MLGNKAKRDLKIDQRRILIDSIETGIPSPQQILHWGERQLPNGKKVGEIKNSKTVNYKRFTPLRDGLFCERIFGPVNSFICACGKRQPRPEIKFCDKCEVEYTDQRIRRYRLGYISLVSPVAHIWYLKGRPSYLSLFLGKRKKKVIALAYCNAYLIEQSFSQKKRIKGSLEPSSDSEEALLKVSPRRGEGLQISRLKGVGKLSPTGRGEGTKSSPSGQEGKESFLSETTDTQKLNKKFIKSNANIITLTEKDDQIDVLPFSYAKKRENHGQKQKTKTLKTIPKVRQYVNRYSQSLNFQSLLKKTFKSSIEDKSNTEIFEKKQAVSYSFYTLLAEILGHIERDVVLINKKQSASNKKRRIEKSELLLHPVWGYSFFKRDKEYSCHWDKMLSIQSPLSTLQNYLCYAQQIDEKVRFTEIPVASSSIVPLKKTFSTNLKDQATKSELIIRSSSPFFLKRYKKKLQNKAQESPFFKQKNLFNKRFSVYPFLGSPLRYRSRITSPLPFVERVSQNSRTVAKRTSSLKQSTNTVYKQVEILPLVSGISTKTLESVKKKRFSKVWPFKAKEAVNWKEKSQNLYKNTFKESLLSKKADQNVWPEKKGISHYLSSGSTNKNLSKLSLLDAEIFWKIAQNREEKRSLYDRAQSLPFLPSFICKGNLRDDLLYFFESKFFYNDRVIPPYCLKKRWPPLRDVHQFMSEQALLLTDQNKSVSPRNRTYFLKNLKEHIIFNGQKKSSTVETTQKLNSKKDFYQEFPFSTDVSTFNKNENIKEINGARITPPLLYRNKKNLSLDVLKHSKKSLLKHSNSNKQDTLSERFASLRQILYLALLEKKYFFSKTRFHTKIIEINNLYASLSCSTLVQDTTTFARDCFNLNSASDESLNGNVSYKKSRKIEKNLTQLLPIKYEENSISKRTRAHRFLTSLNKIGLELNTRSDAIYRKDLTTSFNRRESSLYQKNPNDIRPTSFLISTFTKNPQKLLKTWKISKIIKLAEHTAILRKKNSLNTLRFIQLNFPEKLYRFLLFDKAWHKSTVLEKSLPKKFTIQTNLNGSEQSVLNILQTFFLQPLKKIDFETPPLIEKGVIHNISTTVFSKYEKRLIHRVYNFMLQSLSEDDIFKKTSVSENDIPSISIDDFVSKVPFFSTSYNKVCLNSGLSIFLVSPQISQVLKSSSITFLNIDPFSIKNSSLNNKKGIVKDSELFQEEEFKQKERTQLFASNFTENTFLQTLIQRELRGSNSSKQLSSLSSASKACSSFSSLELTAIREILSYTGGGALQRLLERFNTQSFVTFLMADIKATRLFYKKKVIQGNYPPKRMEKKFVMRLCRRIFKNSRRLKIAQLLTRSKRRPEWMLISTLPVLPPDLRPILQMSESVVVASDLNNLYQRVIYRNNRFYKLSFVDFHLVTAIQRLVQDAVDRLIENGKGGSKPFYTPGGRPLKSLSDVLKGKKGRFRLNLLGKRVDFSGRSVIVVSPGLRIHECGLPQEIALELYHYFLLRRFLLTRQASSIVMAKKIIKRRNDAMWDTLRDIIYHHPVLLNRAPTLHRLGIQAFQPKLVQGNAILLNPLVCSAFNADFDGDQMGVHLPLSIQARAEAWDLLWSRNNLLSPATGQPVLVPSQDMVLGFYYMTQMFSSRSLTSASKAYSSLSPLNLNKEQPMSSLLNPNLKFLPSTGKRLLKFSSETLYHLKPQARQLSFFNRLFFNRLELLQAFQKRQINIQTPVWLEWDGKVESDDTMHNPLEVRLNSFGASSYIFSKYKKRKDENTSQSNLYILTTAGRVLVNQIIFPVQSSPVPVQPHF